MVDNLPLLMRQARQYVMQKSYHEAVEAYQTILQCEGMQKSIDMWLRLAWCYEQVESWDDALAMYEHVIVMYQQNNEETEAKALETKLQSIHAHTHSELENHSDLSVNESDEAMDFPELLLCLKRMGSELTLAEGSVLCKAGDLSDVLWLLEEGTLGVQLPDYLLDGEDVLSAADGLSVLVGELGFFTRQRRSAKVWTKDICRLYQIEMSDIDACPIASFRLALHELLKQYWMYPILSKHSIFERMNDIDRRSLCDLFEPVDVLSGVSLIHYDEDHDGAYLLQQGCLFFVYESEDGEKQVSSMFPGDMVHLGGLLHAYRANYEVRAATNVRLLHLSRKNIEAFIKSRPWMVDVLLRYSRRSAWCQVMRPDDAYLWMTNREIQHRRVTLNTDD